MIGGRKFHSRPALTICAGVALAILIALGNWQLQRLEWKRELIAAVSAASESDAVNFISTDRSGLTEYAPVYVEGAFISNQTIRVFGTLDGDPGAYLFDPLAAETGEILYVNRGFAPYAELKNAAFAPPSDMVRIEGLLRRPETPVPPASWFRRTGPDASGYWYLRDPVAMAAAAGLGGETVIPFYIDQHAVEGVNWPKGGTTRLDFHNRHLEYALTWFGLAATLFGVWFAMSFQRRP